MVLPYRATLASSLFLATHAAAQQPEPAPGAPATEPASQSQLESGGLRPPEAVDAPEPATEQAGEQEVERELRRADAEDTGRGLEFAWLGGEIGYQYAALQALGAGDLWDNDAISDSQGGLVYGGGVGLRLFVITAGARFRYGSFEDWNMWSLNAEGGLRIPLGSLEVSIVLGGGYVRVGGIAEDAISARLDASELSASGFNLRTGGGLDLYLSNTFSVGASLNGEVTFLSRSALDPVEMPSSDEAFYASDGSGVGMALTATLVLGLHF